MKGTTLLLIMAGLCCEAAAQTDLDSLYAVWQDPQRPDSIRAAAYKAYIWEGYLYSKPDTALLLADAMLAFAEAHDLPKAKAQAYNILGTAHSMQGNYARAITCYEQSNVISEGCGYKQGIVASLANLGSVYRQQGNYPKAVDCLQRALALNEELGNRRNMGIVMGGLGTLYAIQGAYAKAMDYHQKSLALAKEMGDKYSEVIALMNIGSCYSEQDQEDNAQAQEYFQQALAIAVELGDTGSRATILSNLGNIFSEQGDQIKALDHYQRSLALSTELGDKADMANSLTRIGKVHGILGAHPKAVEYCERALALAREVGSLDYQKDACKCLYDTYKAMGKGSEALGYLEQMHVFDDSLQATETAKKLEQMEFAREMFADSVTKADEARVIEEGHQDEIRAKNRTRNYLAVSGLALLLVAGGLYGRSRYMRRSRDLISKERDRSENLLLNILPAEIAEELKTKGRADARDFEMVSILFTDFKGFTEASAKLSAQELVAEINTCFEAFDGIIGRHGIEKIKTIGDAYMAAGGLPVPTPGSTMNTVLAALEMQVFIKQRKTANEAEGKPAFEMRVGIHTGPVVAGIVGVKKFAYDIWGDTVNIASRMESSGDVGQVNISEATYALVKDASTPLSEGPAFLFTPRGKVQAKGKGEMEMYFVRRSTEEAEENFVTMQQAT